MDIIPVINRAIKRHKQLRKWARREGVTCYRIYDRDIPQAPLTIDIYTLLPQGIADREQAAAFMEEQEGCIAANDAHIIEEINARRYLVINSFCGGESGGITEADVQAIAAGMGVDIDHLIVKQRERGKGGGRYASFENDAFSAPYATGIVYESGLLFKVDLVHRIDTGLFLDHRPIRAIIRKESEDKRVLNLFCYTGSLTVAAIAGGAKCVTSVDLSNTYLEWARQNASLNAVYQTVVQFVKSDVVRFLDMEAKRRAAQSGEERKRTAQGGRREYGTTGMGSGGGGGDGLYDIIILDPPTFSSSAGAPMLDLSKDWPMLIQKCIKLLSASGVLYFSTNSRKRLVTDDKFRDMVQCVSTDGGVQVECQDITAQTIPPDFPLHKPHRCYAIRRVGNGAAGAGDAMRTDPE